MPASAKKPSAAPAKLDLFRVHKADYVAKKQPVLVTPASGQYLLVEGRGSPTDACFADRLGALYSMAFTIKMTRKFDGLGDYAVAKLESRYPNLDVNAGALPPMEEWDWELFIRTPDEVTAADLEKALAALRKRKKEGDAALVRLERIEEGECVQMLHVGPYEAEAATIAAMRESAESQGRRFVGPHHEVYLSDPRRVAPEKLKTILRMPVRPA